MEKNAKFAGPELVCADCGARFRARRVTDGVEEICDACYEARFPARDLGPHAAQRYSNHPLAAD